jgi:hypothetical protein
VPDTVGDLVQQLLSSPGGFVPLLLKGCYTPAIFGRRRPLSTNAERVDLLGHQGQNPFQPNLAFPLVPEVILVKEPFSEPKVKLGQADVVRILMKKKASPARHAKILAMDAKTM